MSAIKKIVPGFVKELYKRQKSKKNIIIDFLYDYNRYVKYSGSRELLNKENMAAFLIKEYHAVEKGLALRNPKPGFGLSRISKLVDVLSSYAGNYGQDETVNVTIAALKEYVEFDEKFNQSYNPVIEKINRAITTLKSFDGIGIGGTKEVTKSDILETLNFDYSAFVKSRFSTRDFTDVPVDVNLIKSAIENAIYTPSVCNRQAWKVYLVTPENAELKSKFLSVQNGNRGFGEYISSLVVITGKLSSFFDYERNQVFIDGGMFAMAVLLSLHSKGLGTCCLNTSYTAARNEEFKKVMNMDEDSVPIMFIAVGNLKDRYKVAVSKRKALEEIVTEV